MKRQAAVPLTDGQLSNDQAVFELGDLLVAYLQQLSVEYVFGVPGGSIEPLYNALARSARQGGPRAVVARHETDAVFMADGYARQTGKLGVCCATTGPGTTNLVTGVASAYEDQTPMLIITAQTALAMFGWGALQESSCTGINTVGMFQYCTRFNTFVSHIEQFERKLFTAVMAANHSPSGPAHLSIPVDVLRSASPVAQPSYRLSSLVHRPSLFDHSTIDELCQYIEQARRLVFVIGEGCNESIGTILDVALLVKATVVTTPHGKGLVSPYHPLYRGVIGFAGHDSANNELTDPNTDIILAIGTNLGEWATGGWDRTTLLNDRLIHIESVESHLTRSPMAKLQVHGRIVTICEYLLEHLRKVGVDGEILALSDTWRREMIEVASDKADARVGFEIYQEERCYDDSIPIKPQRLMRGMTELFPPSTCYLADNGNSVAWAIHYLHPFDRRIAGRREMNAGLFRTSCNFASMGWAIGAAVGTALGSPGRPIVCITGDGSLLMCGQEITVAVQERLPIIFVILNDSALGMVKHGQRLAGAEPVGFELPQVDYAGYARAMGAEGYTVRSAEDLAALDINAICNRAGPTMLDVIIDPDEVPPMRTRLRVLGTAK